MEMILGALHHLEMEMTLGCVRDDTGGVTATGDR